MGPRRESRSGAGGEMEMLCAELGGADASRSKEVTLPEGAVRRSDGSASEWQRNEAPVTVGCRHRVPHERCGDRAQERRARIVHLEKIKITNGA